MSTNLTHRPKGLQAADFNGDGRLDVATANPDDKTVSVLLGKGDGGFQAVTNHGTGDAAADLAVADLNGDGKPDIVAAVSTPHVLAVLLNDGSGGFPASATSFDVRLAPAGLYLGDFNGDGKLDAVVAGTGGFTSCASVCLGFVAGKGDGTFTTPVPDANYASGGIEDRVVRQFSESGPLDLDGDGKLDVAFTSGQSFLGDNWVMVGFGQGDGTFKMQTLVASPGPRVSGFWADGTPISTLVAGDFNGDSLVDLALGARSEGSPPRPGGARSSSPARRASSGPLGASPAAVPTAATAAT
ncbi:MAG: VCBS repeat-containing protein [Candidatus Schekmanbacteria bacterium]|nr:VCBS repeat-containing protein [Candidatus Schekmanbacteria bacterium]